MTKLIALKANITSLKLDAIVNAANTSLLGGGGVDGAIHRAAGLDLVHECRLLGGCRTGEAKLTRGYKLPAAHIIHTVGPVWQGGDRDEDHLLSSCYLRCLEVADQKRFSSIAFPSISTGVYRFPKERAASIAVKTCSDFITGKPSSLQEIIFCCFSDEDLSIYAALLPKAD